MADRIQMTEPEGLLVSALTAALAPRFLDRENSRLMLSLVEETAPLIDRSHRYLGPLADAAERLSRMSPGQGSDWSWAHMEASNALAEFSRWRAGLFWERVKKPGAG